MIGAISVLSSCEQTFAIFFPLPFLCSPGQKVEVKTFPSGSCCMYPILPCSCQKIQHLKACFSLSSKSHTSVKCANLPFPFPVGFVPFCCSSRCTLLPGTGTNSWLVPTACSPKLSRCLSLLPCGAQLWGLRQSIPLQQKPRNTLHC